jgi:hypothetical protein
MPIRLERQFCPVLNLVKPVCGKRIAVLLLCVLVSSAGIAAAQELPEEELQFHSDVPLGAQGFTLKPSGQSLYVMALVQNPVLEGMHQARVGERRVLLDAQGRQVDFYPQQVTFRVTASAWSQDLLNVRMYPVQASEDTNAYLLDLRFRLKIFRGLSTREVYPTDVSLLGMPADVPYNERIFGVTFNLDQVPLDDRVVLEVLSADGQRLCKFHLDLE